ncbi:uncharacterized protein LOC115371718 [Myripristis murdjan]|uniref:Serine-rich adhesin for platelets-like n=1 Tax=Myripristis murdjan TaxID=586833 RepID=A0A667YXQ2_9TELE|nr:uncharacterized protein LOC115371718 [Myripristis murdjan]
MKGSITLLLLCCIKIMAAPLYGADGMSSTTDSGSSTDGDPTAIATTELSSVSTTNTVLSTRIPTQLSEGSTSSTTDSHTTVSHTAAASVHTPPQSTTSSPVVWLFDRKSGFIILTVTGSLIILCTLLLVSTVTLACKVCHLRRQVNNSADLISNHEYWMGTAQRNGGKSETDVRESTILLSQFTQAEEDITTSAAKEDGEKEKEAGKPGEEASKSGKEEGNTAEQNSVSETKKDAGDSPATKPTSSEGSEEPKAAV